MVLWKFPHTVHSQHVKWTEVINGYKLYKQVGNYVMYFAVINVCERLRFVLMSGEVLEVLMH